MSDPNVLAITEAVTLQPWLTAGTGQHHAAAGCPGPAQGAMRAISIVLAVMTGALCAVAVAAYAMDPGNLWQIMLLMASPPVLVLTVGTLIMGLILNPRPAHQ